MCYSGNGVRHTATTSLVRKAVAVLLSRMSLLAQNPNVSFSPVTLQLSSFEICMYFASAVVFLFVPLDNDVVFDLLSKKKLDAIDQPMHGLSSLSIRSLEEFDDAFTLILLNGRIRYVFRGFFFVGVTSMAEMES